MQFSVNKRDGPARIGELVIEDKRVTTPNILFVNTSRFKAPDYADFIITNKDPKTKKPTFAIFKRSQKKPKHSQRSLKPYSIGFFMPDSTN
jgi:queuine/archaeosine tRNA-ribosyltransferase